MKGSLCWLYSSPHILNMVQGRGVRGTGWNHLCSKYIAHVPLLYHNMGHPMGGVTILMENPAGHTRYPIHPSAIQAEGYPKHCSCTCMLEDGGLVDYSGSDTTCLEVPNHDKSCAILAVCEELLCSASQPPQKGLFFGLFSVKLDSNE